MVDDGDVVVGPRSPTSSATATATSSVCLVCNRCRPGAAARAMIGALGVRAPYGRVSTGDYRIKNSSSGRSQATAGGFAQTVPVNSAPTLR